MKIPAEPAPDPGRLCFLIAKDMRTALDRDLAGFSLRAQQAAVLVHCIRQQGASPGRLARDVGTDTAGITGLIDQLGKKRLVVRRANPDDRRAVTVEPTQAGQALAPRLRFVFSQFAKDCLRGFSAEESATLGKLLERLHRNVEVLLAAPADRREILR